MVKQINVKKTSISLMIIFILMILLFFLLMWSTCHKKQHDSSFMLEKWDTISLSPEYIAQSMKNTKLTAENLLD